MKYGIRCLILYHDKPARHCKTRKRRCISTYVTRTKIRSNKTLVSDNHVLGGPNCPDLLPLDQFLEHPRAYILPRDGKTDRRFVFYTLSDSLQNLPYPCTRSAGLICTYAAIGLPASGSCICGVRLACMAFSSACGHSPK